MLERDVMPAIKKILFPVDFSAGCVGAARYVETFAGWFQAEIMLLHVVGSGTNVLAEELRPRSQAQLNAFLADELKYFTTQRVCVVGDPADKIVEMARSWSPDLVMMPTHRPGFFRTFLLGSVTAKVLHDVECPVWTGIHAEEAPPLEKITWARVLCAIDLGERSPDVLKWAAFLARAHQAELRIVHATPELEAAPTGRYLDEEFAASLAAAAKSRIAPLQAAAGTNAAIQIARGNPGTAVTCAAKDFSADLLVIGRHNGTGIAGRLRHNAYAIIRESPCPVISV
jgi:nucleotide-binding universal stress UspA family protein